MSIEKFGVIYCFINKLNGMLYIGKSLDVIERLNAYRLNQHNSQRKFYNATKKYGWDHFDFEIMEKNVDESQLSLREKYWIKHLNTFDISRKNAGYNLTAGGEGISGLKHSEATKTKISKSNKGKTHSEATKAKLSEVLKGRSKSVKTKAKMSEVRRGKPGTKHSNESKAKMSAATSGENNPFFGKNHSQETRAKISQSWSIAHRQSMKPVECIETGQKFESLRGCARQMNIDNSHLRKHLKGEQKHVKGFHFKYITKE